MQDILDAILPDFLTARREMDRQLVKVMRLQENNRVQPSPAGCCQGGAGDISPPCQEPEEGAPV